MMGGRHRIGILGGMGPAATVDFYSKLIEETPAKSDQEHLPVVIWADPRVPDRSRSILECGDDPTPWLRQGIDSLIAAGCDLLAVPCNTAHAFVPRLALESGIKLISLIDVTVDEVLATGNHAVGLLATTGTLRARLYSDALARRQLTVLEPDEEDQNRATAVIRNVKSGLAGTAEATVLTEIAQSLIDRGAERVVIACTELILVADNDLLAMPIIDPARLLARRIVRIALGQETGRRG